MDLFSIVSKIWRHKLVTIPLILLTLMGLLYEFKLKPAVYQASASILLLNPSKTAVNINNPYINNADDYLSVIANVMVTYATSDSGQEALRSAGVSPGYQVTQTAGTNELPIVQIIGVGSNSQEAIQSANIIAQVINNELYQMQEIRHVNSRYLITADEVLQPTVAKTSISSKARTLISITALGFLLLLSAVSISESRQRRRPKSSARHDARIHVAEDRPHPGAYADTRVYNSTAEDPRYWSSPNRDSIVREEVRSFRAETPGE